MFAPQSYLTGRLKSIDFLRGCAVLGVVLTHSYPHEAAHLSTQKTWFGYLGTIVGKGALGVPLFFVISGFCIHLRWAKRHAETGQTKLDFIDFWKRRLRRLYPPYLVVLCLSMSLVVIAYLLGRANYYPEPRLRWMGLDFLTHLFMLHGFHPFFDTGAGNPPMWTLAREEFFYLMYFGLLAFRRIFKLPATVLCVLTLGLIFPYLFTPLLSPDSPFWKTIYTSVFVFWIQWVLGMAAVEVYFGFAKLPNWCRAWWMALVWAVAAEVAAIYLPMLIVPLRGLAFYTLINFCIDKEESSGWFEKRMPNWVAGAGLFSYSLYLVHQLPITIFNELFKSVAYSTNMWLALLGMIIKVVASFYFAKLFFFLVERHFLPTPVRPRRLRASDSARLDSGIRLKKAQR